MQLTSMPPLRALVLVIKALLKEAGLNEVFVGGLSSYSVTLMVMSHLLQSGFRLLHEGGSLPSLWPPLESELPDLGTLLLGFLEWFGHIFSYEDRAVSVERVSPLYACRHMSFVHLRRSVLSLCLSPSPFYWLPRSVQNVKEPSRASVVEDPINCSTNCELALSFVFMRRTRRTGGWRVYLHVTPALLGSQGEGSALDHARHVLRTSSFMLC